MIMDLSTLIQENAEGIEEKISKINDLIKQRNFMVKNEKSLN